MQALQRRLIEETLHVFRGVTSKQSEKDIQNMVSQLKARDNTIVALEKDLEHKSDQYKMIFSSYSHKGEIVDSVKGIIYFRQTCISFRGDSLKMFFERTTQAIAKEKWSIFFHPI